jgi:pimeloyl-ACP methyl ester carboxylesterase
VSAHPEHIREVPALGVTVHALERNPGGSPPLLFLHGWLDNCRGFDWLIQALPESFRTIALDFRGHGRSGHLPGGLYHLTDYLADVEFTLDACRVQRVHLVGHSLGGTVAFLYAAAQPDRVASITAIESVGTPGGGGDRPVHRIRRFVADLHKRSLKRVYRSVEEAAARLRQNNAGLSEAAALQLARYGTRSVEGGVEFTFDPAHRRTSGTSLDEDQTLTLLRAVECPVQVVIGSRGLSLEEERTKCRLRALRAREPMVADGGHHVHMDSPAEVARRVASFVSEAL